LADKDAEAGEGNQTKGNVACAYVEAVSKAFESWNIVEVFAELVDIAIDVLNHLLLQTFIL
jgi:hypothetical protein